MVVSRVGEAVDVIVDDVFSLVKEAVVVDDVFSLVKEAVVVDAAVVLVVVVEVEVVVFSVGRK